MLIRNLSYVIPSLDFIDDRLWSQIPSETMIQILGIFLFFFWTRFALLLGLGEW